jgi:anti-sigma B factor antagonist
VEPMHLRLREDRGWTVLEIRGVVDVASAPQLRQTLQEVQFGGSVCVLLDLTEVELIDSFGLGVLVGARKRAVAHDGELALVVTSGRLRHVFELTGLDTTLRLVADAEDVLDA